jgi:hypothetical protein
MVGSLLLVAGFGNAINPRLKRRRGKKGSI